MMPEGLHCKVCGREYEVSEVDPDSTLSDIRGHIVSSHPQVLDDPILQIADGRAR